MHASRPVPLRGTWSLDILYRNIHRYGATIDIPTRSVILCPMDEKQKRELEFVVLDALVSSLQAQVRAVERLRDNLPRARKKSSAAAAVGPHSQLDLVEEVLAGVGTPLHIDEIIQRVQKAHGVGLDRESIVSALSKKIHRGERFTRTGKNTFALLTE
jgi:hypothetical protein